MSQISQLDIQDKEIKKIQLSIAYVTIVLSSFAIFLTIVFFVFNIRYRNFRLIKMSSPNINNIINFNCVILYLCPIFNSIKGLYINNESLANSMCQVNTWFLPLSSTAIYAAMLAKAWRIYKIFETTPKMKKIVIKDVRLVIYIVCMVMFDLSVLTVWQFLDPVKLRARYVYETQTHPSQIILPSSFLSRYPTTPLNTANLFLENVTSSVIDEFNTDSSVPIVQNFSHRSQLKLLFECNSNYNEVWITILTMYKIILLMYGIYLAWIIRNINVPSMNDSKYLLLSTYAIIVSGLGSMTLMQLLRDWPDVVQAFFTIGIILATCTTQCLLFIPKIRLWYKRRNDDNFKISLSQIFLQTSSSCYYTDKQNKNSSSSTNPNLLNLEDELCELLHENSQLKNYLKEKEEIIKLLQDKIRMTKANLFQANQHQNFKNLSNVNIIDKSDSGIDIDAVLSNNAANKTTNNNSSLTGLSTSNEFGSLNENFSALHQQIGYQSDFVKIKNTKKNSEKIFDIDTPNCKAAIIMENFKLSGLQNNTNENKNSNLLRDSSSDCKPSLSTLKNDLDEVEELTSRVRDSISVDLLNTRRYSPLLYEYYRKHLELAKSIQSTYNIQCNSLFDAMTLMRKCLKDYCQTVHNPEYLAFDTIHTESSHHFSFNDYIKKNNLANENQSIYQSNTLPQLGGAQTNINTNNFNNQCFSQHLFQIPSALTNLKSTESINQRSNGIFMPKNQLLNQNDDSKNHSSEINHNKMNMLTNQRNSDFLNKVNSNVSEESSSSSAISTTSSSIPALKSIINNTSSTLISSPGTNNNFETKNKNVVATIDNKQTYV